MEAIRLARRADLPRLTALWQECFGDSPAYIENFYRHSFERIYIPIIEHEGLPVGMVHLLPCTHSEKGVRKGALYAYAVGMTGSLRGSGLMRSLLSRVLRECEARGILLVLAPQNEKLFDYYASYGLTPQYSQYRGIVTREMLLAKGASGAGFSVREISDDGYFLARESCYRMLSYVSFDAPSVAYALDENRFCSGFALAIESPVGLSCMMGVQERGRLLVRELCCADKPENVLLSIFDYHQVSECIIHSPYALPGTEKCRPTMATAQKEGYMGLLLD